MSTCKLCKKTYIGETGRRLADCFREHLRDVEKNDTDASKPVARHFNLPNHNSHHNMTICGLSLHLGNTESRKNLEHLGTLYPLGINERLSINLFANSCYHISTNGKAPLRPHKNQQHPQFLYSFGRSKGQLSKSLTVVIRPLSTRLIKPNFPLGAEKRTNELNPRMTPSLGIEPGPHWWEASAHHRAIPPPSNAILRLLFCTL